MSGEQQIRNHASLVWSVADKAAGVYKQSEYGRVILPLVILRRLNCVLEPNLDSKTTSSDVRVAVASLSAPTISTRPIAWWRAGRFRPGTLSPNGSASQPGLKCSMNSIK